MKKKQILLSAFAIIAASAANAAFILDYTIDAGGKNDNPLNGLAASAMYDIVGDTLNITLTNTSSDVPVGFEVSDSLLVSLAFDLPEGYTVINGTSAAIADGSVGLGKWSSLSSGDSVAEEWAWTVGGAGDLLESYGFAITTSSGSGSATATRFDGRRGSINGPFGGIAAAPAIIGVPKSKKAVSNAIVFSLTLNAPLDETMLYSTIAHNSKVEFGSDMQYLTPQHKTPEPTSAALLGLGGMLLVGRRRR